MKTRPLVVAIVIAVALLGVALFVLALREPSSRATLPGRPDMTRGGILNDWSPTWQGGDSSVKIVRFEEGQLPVITGMTRGEGVILVGPVLLRNEHSGSSPRNRFHFDDGRDLGVGPNALVLITRHPKLDRLVVQVIEDNTIVIDEIGKPKAGVK